MIFVISVSLYINKGFLYSIKLRIYLTTVVRTTLNDVNKHEVPSDYKYKIIFTDLYSAWNNLFSVFIRLRDSNRQLMGIFLCKIDTIMSFELFLQIFQRYTVKFNLFKMTTTKSYEIELNQHEIIMNCCAIFHLVDSNIRRTLL